MKPHNVLTFFAFRDLRWVEIEFSEAFSDPHEGDLVERRIAYQYDNTVVIDYYVVNHRWRSISAADAEKIISMKKLHAQINTECDLLEGTSHESCQIPQALRTDGVSFSASDRRLNS